jgi:flagellar biosynthesis protein FlhA
MDGASKFVRGDAIAAVVITFVNVLGGLYVGMVENGWQVMECM